MRTQRPRTKAPVSGKPAPIIIEPIEVPAGAEVWPVSTCVSTAIAGGVNEALAVESCEIVRQQWGDPSDSGSILVPSGTTRERLLADAIASVEGGARVADKALRVNRWWAMAKSILGIKIMRERATAPARKANADMVPSSVFGGALISREARRQQGWYKGR